MLPCLGEDRQTATTVSFILLTDDKTRHFQILQYDCCCRRIAAASASETHLVAARAISNRKHHLRLRECLATLRGGAIERIRDLIDTIEEKSGLLEEDAHNLVQ